MITHIPGDDKFSRFDAVETDVVGVLHGYVGSDLAHGTEHAPVTLTHAVLRADVERVVSPG